MLKKDFEAVDCVISQCIWEGGPPRPPVQKDTVITTNNPALIMLFGTTEISSRCPDAPQPQFRCSSTSRHHCQHVNCHFNTSSGGVPHEVCPYPQPLSMEIAISINRWWRAKYGVTAEDSPYVTASLQ